MPGNGPQTQGQLEEELAQIRRYEDFSTIGRYLCVDALPGDLLPRLTPHTYTHNRLGQGCHSRTLSAIVLSKTEPK